MTLLPLMVAGVMQAQSGFVLLDEKVGEVAPNPGGVLVYTCEVRMLGRKGAVVLDTTARALPYSLQYRAEPKTLLEFAIKGLGRRGSRVVTDPKAGTVAWVNVTMIRRM